MLKQLYGYHSDNSLLYKIGFHTKHSTLSALIRICDDLLKNMDDGKLNCVIFLDIRKAFDSRNHEILVKKCNVSLMVNYPVRK